MCHQFGPILYDFYFIFPVQRSCWSQPSSIPLCQVGLSSIMHCALYDPHFHWQLFITSTHTSLVGYSITLTMGTVFSIKLHCVITNTGSFLIPTSPTLSSCIPSLPLNPILLIPRSCFPRSLMAFPNDCFNDTLWPLSLLF